MRQPVQVLVYPVNMMNSRWQYLLLHRLASRGDFWQGVTGGVEEGEEILDAARREMIEETGLVPFTVERIDYTFSYPISEQWRHLYAESVQEITEYVFLAQVSEPQAPSLDAREHDAWQWCSFDDALSSLLWPGNIEALKQCDKFLKCRAGVG